MLRIGIVAGEPSGDFLAAELVQAIKRRQPTLIVEGIGGDKLRQVGCNILFPMERLAVMGLFEVCDRVAELLKIRKKLKHHFLDNPPDVFIGVDAPDFNLALEKNLRENGIKTVHYVSPSVWAWRTYRVTKIKKAVDLMLSLFPFEVDFFKAHGISAKFVGHPLADQIAIAPNKQDAHRKLGIPGEHLTIAILPGSRKSEYNKLIPPFIETALWLCKHNQDIQFVSSVLDSVAEEQLLEHVAKYSDHNLKIKVYKNRMPDVLAASDAVLLASGTITLEAMLYKVPMVVAYKVNILTYWILRMLVKIEFASLPNLLANHKLVPEFLQFDCRADNLGPAIQDWIDSPDSVALLCEKFNQLHKTLKMNASESAARAVLEVVNAK